MIDRRQTKALLYCGFLSNEFIVLEVPDLDVVIKSCRWKEVMNQVIVLIREQWSEVPLPALSDSRSLLFVSS